MSETLRVLFIEDSPIDVQLMVSELQQSGYTIKYQQVDSPSAMITALHKKSLDIIISNYSLPKFNALDALMLLKQHHLDLPFIIVSGNIGEKLAVEAMKNGAHDCLTKDNLGRLSTAVQRGLREARVRFENKHALIALRTRATQQAAVAELGLEVLRGISLENLMNRVSEVVVKTLDVEYCQVLENRPDESVLILKAGTGWNDGSVGRLTVLPGSESQAGYTLQIGKPVIVDDIRSETRFRGSSLLFAHNIVSGLSVIIHGQDHSFGVLAAHTTKRRKFTRDDIHFMGAIANILSSVIEQKRVEEALNKANIELVKSREVLRNLATHDELTGFYNRRELFRFLKEEILRSQRYHGTLTILMLDLDHFKQVNDKYGHQVGDELLRMFAQIVQENIRSVDRAARYGGEEFVIILPETSSEKAPEFAERLRKIIAAKPYMIPQEKDDPLIIPVTVSIGIANYPEDADSLEDLINKSDLTLYAAKHRGRNCVVNYPQIHSENTSLC